MYWNITHVFPESHLTLLVRFEDGLMGKARFLPSRLTGLFEPLKDADFFNKVFINHGAVTWPRQLDFAPDAMYDEIKEHGEWVLK